MTVVPSSPPPCGSPSRLTDADRQLIAKARELAGLSGTGFRRHTRVHDPAMAMASALGEAQHLLRELADVAERTGGQQ